MCGPPALSTGYQIPYRLASKSPSTFTSVEVGTTVRQFTAAKLALESAYIFRLLAKMKHHYGLLQVATVITTEKRRTTPGPKSTVVVLWGGELGLNGSHELAGSMASWVRPCTVACLHSPFTRKTGMSKV